MLIGNPRDPWTQFFTECQGQGGDGNLDVYRTICIQLQISPMYFLVIGENSADKVPDKHKHTINVFLGGKHTISLKVKQDGVCMMEVGGRVGV